MHYDLWRQSHLRLRLLSPCPFSHAFICTFIPTFFLEVSLVGALSRCLLQVTLPRLPYGRDFEDSLLHSDLVLRVFVLSAFPCHHSPTPTPVPLVSQTAGAFFSKFFLSSLSAYPFMGENGTVRRVSIFSNLASWLYYCSKWLKTWPFNSFWLVILCRLLQYLATDTLQLKGALDYSSFLSLNF